MAEVLLDAKLWNKVFKLLKPATVVAIKKNKGSNQDALIPSNGSGNLSKTDNKKSFFIRYINLKSPCAKRIASRHGYTGKQRLYRLTDEARERGITELRVKEIEKAIVQVAVAESPLPESVCYDSKPVAKATKQPERSTAGFGFVYFVRNDEIYKFGITDNLLRRLKELKPDEILNSVRCSNYQEIEKKMHAHFKEKRIPRTEYFRLDVAEVEEAHWLMTDLADFKGR